MFESTLANSVALNARTHSEDDTNTTTIETVTATSLSIVAHFIDDSSGRTAATAATAAKTSRIQEITANIKAKTTKDPLETGNHKQFQGTTEDPIPNHNTVTAATAAAAEEEEFITDTVPTTSTIDHRTNFNQAPSTTSLSSLTNSSSKNAHNVSNKFEMVSSTLANASTASATPAAAALPPQTTENTKVDLAEPMRPSLSSSSPPQSTSSKQSNNRGNLEINSTKTHSMNAQNSSSSLMGKSNNNNSNNQIIDDNDNIKSVDYINGKRSSSSRSSASSSNDDKNDYVNSDIQLPQSDAPLSTGSIDSSAAAAFETNQMKPRPDAVYFVVAVIGGAKIWARTLARTISDMGPPFNDSLGTPLRPIYVDLPTNGRYTHI